MAFNKDIPPTKLGKNQPAPQDLFQSMKQGAMPRHQNERDLMATMKQRRMANDHPTGKTYVGRSMKQGGPGK